MYAAVGIAAVACVPATARRGVDGVARRERTRARACVCARIETSKFIFSSYGGRRNRKYVLQ